MFRIRRIAYGAALITAAAIAGCSNDDTDGGGACSITLSGGLTGTYSCTAMLAGYTTLINTTSYNVSVSSPISLNSTINFIGEATVGTYARGASGASGGIAITSGSSSWSVSAGTGGAGSYSLVLSSVTTVSSTATSKAYAVHGTLDATIPASQGSTITAAVTMHVAF